MLSVQGFYPQSQFNIFPPLQILFRSTSFEQVLIYQVYFLLPDHDKVSNRHKSGA